MRKHKQAMRNYGAGGSILSTSGIPQKVSIRWYTFKGDGYEKKYTEFSGRGSYKSCWYKSRTYIAIIEIRDEERRGWAIHLSQYGLPSDLYKNCPLVFWSFLFVLLSFVFWIHSIFKSLIIHENLAVYF